MTTLSGHSALREQRQRIGRRPVETDLEVQERRTRRAGAHGRDPLSASYRIALAHGDGLRVAIRAQIRLVVLDDQQLTIPEQPCAAINDAAVAGGANLVAELPRDIEPLAAV